MFFHLVIDRLGWHVFRLYSVRIRASYPQEIYGYQFENLHMTYLLAQLGLLHLDPWTCHVFTIISLVNLYFSFP